MTPDASSDARGGQATIADWTGTRVLVTGASSGIGAAIARDLAAEGAIVGVCARRTELLEQVLADCRVTSPASKAWTVDLAELDGIAPFVRRVEEELGGIDVLVNNAGQTLAGEAMGTAWTDVEHVMRLNYLSPVRVTLEALPAMQARGAGHVVTLSSMAARMATPGEAAYAASKAALTAWFEAFAGEHWDDGVRFHLVYPALIDVRSEVDGDDALVTDGDGTIYIPSPVLAREIRRQLARGDFELYVPHLMKSIVAGRARDVEGSIAFMAGLYRSGSLHPAPPA